MEQYQNLGGDSGVTGYEIGPDFIRVQFKGGATYLYDYSQPGAADVEEMKQLAVQGQGLGSYISRVVRKRYAAKEP